MIKGLKYIGNIDGIPQFEEYIEENTRDIYPDYPTTVTEFIRRKYTLDEELSINAKGVAISNSLCTEEQRTQWLSELSEFLSYREQCKSQAKILCGIT